MTKKIFLLVLLTGLFITASAQQNSYLNAKSTFDEKIYIAGKGYKVPVLTHEFKSETPKNVILLIGDGMGVSQVFAGLTANRGRLYLSNCRHTGFAMTQSADQYITDSAAAGTALSSGVRTYNGAIGVDMDKKPLKTILEEAEENGLATGLVATSTITHATPASFIAHQPSRSMYEEIAADFLKVDIDVFIGGGKNHFTKRKDGRNLVNELKEKGYKYEEELEKIKKVKKGKLAALVDTSDAGRLAKRGMMLPVSTKTAINILDNNDKGFFLMVEGSQIDWGGHANNTVYVLEDVLDFDRAVGMAMEFAAKDGETLIVVTSDHETGGMALTGGSIEQGILQAGFATGGHTSVMVPVFAYGPGAENFTGIMKNTDIPKKMRNLLFESSKDYLVEDKK